MALCKAGSTCLLPLSCHSTGKYQETTGDGPLQVSGAIRGFQVQGDFP